MAETTLSKNVGDQIIARVNNLCQAGFSMPADYNYTNAIKMSILKLQELKDKNGQNALDVCTPESVQSALFKMVTRGLNAAYNQCYLIVRGKQLCCDDSYFGKVLMVRRVYPDWKPIPVVIREGDVFEFYVDTNTGMRHVLKHEQKLENIDKGFVGGYIYLPTGELYIMTKKQILAAWSKSSSREQATHKLFDEKMVGKTLVNSACNMIINATPAGQFSMSEEENMIENKLPSNEYTDYEEVDEATGEIRESKQLKESEEKPSKEKTPAEQPAPVAQPASDDNIDMDF